MKRLALLLVFSTASFAQTSGWIPPPPPDDVCQQVEKNVRAAYIAWASDAKETFSDLKADMRAALAGKGAKETQVQKLYETVFTRIEAGDFSPPKYPNRVAGHLAAKKFALESCAAEIKID